MNKSLIKLELEINLRVYLSHSGSVHVVRYIFSQQFKNALKATTLAESLHGEPEASIECPMQKSVSDTVQEKSVIEYSDDVARDSQSKQHIHYVREAVQHQKSCT